MRRAPYVITGTAIGAVAVIAIPSQGTPQQVAVAGNAAATGGGGSTATSAGTGSTGGGSQTSQPTSSATASTTVLGSLATNQYGQLQVKLTVKDGKITDVGFVTFTASDDHSVGIDQSAVPILIQETIAAQSAQIQGVSGATYTTSSYEQSLQAAIDKAALHG